MKNKVCHTQKVKVENREQAEVDGEQEEVKEYGDLEHFILEEPDLRIYESTIGQFLSLSLLNRSTSTRSSWFKQQTTNDGPTPESRRKRRLPFSLQFFPLVNLSGSQSTSMFFDCPSVCFSQSFSHSYGSRVCWTSAGFFEGSSTRERRQAVLTRRTSARRCFTTTDAGDEESEPLRRRGAFSES